MVLKDISKKLARFQFPLHSEIQHHKVVPHLHSPDKNVAFLQIEDPPQLLSLVAQCLKITKNVAFYKKINIIRSQSCRNETF